jgi:hypothetical protein
VDVVIELTVEVIFKILHVQSKHGVGAVVRVHASDLELVEIHKDLVGGLWVCQVVLDLLVLLLVIGLGI